MGEVPPFFPARVCPRRGGNSPLAGTAIPVSYTHLDVYKRQVFMYPLAACSVLLIAAVIYRMFNMKKSLICPVVLVVGALTFFPALALGPILEHLLLYSGHTLTAFMRC